MPQLKNAPLDILLAAYSVQQTATELGPSVGVASLPSGAAVEVDALFEVG